MRAIAIFLQTVLLGAFSLGAIAQAENEFLQKLKSIDTLSGNFSQAISDQEGNEVQEPTAGKFLIKRPGYFYWETQPPYEQLIIGNPDRLWVYDPDLEQVTVHNQSQLENSPASILSGEDQSIKEKYIVTADRKKDAVEYHFRGKASDQKSFEVLTFVFKKDVLDSLLLQDNLGQTTRIHFTDVRVNKKIDTVKFDFEPPAGVDVIVQE